MAKTPTQGLISMAEYKPYPPSQDVTKATGGRGYVPFGDDNLYPEYLDALFKGSPTHGAAVTTISQMLYGDGLVVNYGRLNKLMVEVVKDCKKYGGAYIEVVQNGDASQVQLNYIPFTSIRRADKSAGAVRSVFYCKDWTKRGQRGMKEVEIPTFNRATIETDLRQILIIDCFVNGEDVYPLPDYIASVMAIDLERQIQELHLANVENGMFPAFAVNFANGVPETKDARDSIVNEFLGKLRGPSKGGKAIFTFAQSKEYVTDIQVMEMSNVDKLYDQMGKDVVLQILRGHRVTSPRLMGVLESSGLGNSAEEFDKALRQFYQHVIIPTRELIEDGLRLLGEYLGVKLEFKQDFNEESDVQAAYSGEQVLRLTELVEKVNSGVVKAEQARVIATQALAISAELADAMFPDEVVEEAEQQPAPTALKLRDTRPELTDERGKELLKHLSEVGEVIDTDIWELVSEEEAGCAHAEAQYKPTFLSLDGYANPEERSEWGDVGLYKLRYAYSQNLTANTRPFCREMVAMSASGVVFRFEDIQAMSDAGVNGEFAPQGESAYNIFDWKGGVYCHHHWKRQIYFRKRGPGGKFLPNKGLENDKRVGNVPFVPQKGAEGVAPIDTPSRGSLKNQ